MATLDKRYLTRTLFITSSKLIVVSIHKQPKVVKKEIKAKIVERFLRFLTLYDLAIARNKNYYSIPFLSRKISSHARKTPPCLFFAKSQQLRRPFESFSFDSPKKLFLINIFPDIRPRRNSKFHLPGT